MAQRLAAPLTDPEAIERRHDSVALLVKDAALRAELRDKLNAAPDLARALARLALGRGGPRDLAAVRDGLAGGGRHRAAAQRHWRTAGRNRRSRGSRHNGPTPCSPPNCPPRLRSSCRCSSATAASCAPAMTPGSMKPARCAMNSRRVIAALQSRYCDETGVKTLKIKHNNVLGYFVEVTQQHGDRLMAPPLNATFIHRQTLAGQVRFTTTELGALEAKIASAADRALGIELDAFERLTAQVLGQSEPIKQCAEALAVLDVSSALAVLASERDYVRPQVDDSLSFVIEGGRHPVVEQALARDGTPFVANACDLSPPPAAGEGSGKHLAAHRPEHGRQIDLPAAERADHGAGADGLVRAGEERAARRGGPAVLAGRRRGRSRARTLDLHGRDGRDRGDSQSGGTARARDPRRDRPRHRDLRRPLDRLGDHRASARGQHLPRAVRDALSRADRAFGAAAAPAQRDGAGEGMAGRGRVPARSGARRGGSLLRHPGGEARRPARERDRRGRRRCCRSSRPKTAPRPRASTICRCLRPRRSRWRRSRAPLDRVLAALVALNPDEMSPREAMEAIYRLKRDLPPKS